MSGKGECFTVNSGAQRGDSHHVNALTTSTDNNTPTIIRTSMTREDREAAVLMFVILR
jgi:hypothetical protein